jgi:hypothetical protein
MKNLLIILKISLLLSAGASTMSCNTTPQNKTALKISKIKITDRTLVNYYRNGRKNKDTVITDSNKVEEFQTQLNSMKAIETVEVKSNFGFFEINIFFSNNTKRDLGLIYTKYDGIIIYDYNTNKEYKNNDLEALIAPYFYSINRHQ